MDLAGGSFLPVYMYPLLSYKRENAKHFPWAVLISMNVPNLEIIKENVKHISTFFSMKDGGTVKV